MSTVVEPVPTMHRVDGPQRIYAYDVSWETYLHISEAFRGQHVRLTYDRGTLEIMTTSHEHAFLCSLFHDLVRTLAEEFDLPWKIFADMTCRRESAQRALEPDVSVYIANEPQVVGKRDLDFENDPPPDLAIEIDLSPPKRDRLEVYAGIGIPEVWKFDDRTLVGYRLHEGEYEVVESSLSFPAVKIAEMLPFVQRRHEVGQGTLLRSFRDWVRDKAGN